MAIGLVSITILSMAQGKAPPPLLSLKPLKF
jgi:hypothetical protein